MATKRPIPGAGYSFGLAAARAIETETGIAWEDVAGMLVGPPRPPVQFVRCVVWAAQMDSAKALSRLNIDAQIDSFTRNEYVERILPSVRDNTVAQELEAARVEADQEADREIEQADKSKEEEHGSDD